MRCSAQWQDKGGTPIPGSDRERGESGCGCTAHSWAAPPCEGSGAGSLREWRFEIGAEQTGLEGAEQKSACRTAK